MKREKNRSTKHSAKAPLRSVQTEMDKIIPVNSAEENNARFDRIFERLYRIRGNDLKGLAEEIESEESTTPQQGCNIEHLFHVTTSRIAERKKD